MDCVSVCLFESLQKLLLVLCIKIAPVNTDFLGKPKNKGYFLVARPLRKRNFFEAQKYSPKKNVATIARGLGGGALVAGPQKKTFFAASLREHYFFMFV